MASTSKYAFEKRYDPQNEKDAEELLEIFANLSNSDIELGDHEGGNMNNDFAIAGTEEVRVGADKIGPQTREIVEHLDDICFVWKVGNGLRFRYIPRRYYWARPRLSKKVWPRSISYSASCKTNRE
ncbi:hypothetical protein QE152_g38619 [Popillia japonica]|uniref:Uncharacterized protein n=1 Tax=Popillia japonica TaxID=7064 RepID=A0AAW1HWS4_POPJA